MHNISATIISENGIKQKIFATGVSLLNIFQEPLNIWSRHIVFYVCHKCLKKRGIKSSQSQRSNIVHTLTI